MSARLADERLAEIRQGAEASWDGLIGAHAVLDLLREFDALKAQTLALREAIETVAQFHGAAWLEGTPAWAKDPLIAALAASPENQT